MVLPDAAVHHNVPGRGNHPVLVAAGRVAVAAAVDHIHLGPVVLAGIAVDQRSRLDLADHIRLVGPEGVGESCIVLGLGRLHHFAAGRTVEHAAAVPVAAVDVVVVVHMARVSSDIDHGSMAEVKRCSAAGYYHTVAETGWWDMAIVLGSAFHRTAHAAVAADHPAAVLADHRTVEIGDHHTAAAQIG